MVDYEAIEKRVTGIVTDKPTYSVMELAEKNHGLLCLFLLHAGKGRWGNAKKYVNEHNLTLSDSTFRDRMKEAEAVKLATSKLINNNRRKREWTETALGYKVIGEFLKTLSKIKQAYIQHSE